MTALVRIMNYELRIMVFVISMILASVFITHPVYAQTAIQSSVNQLTPSSLPLPPYVSPTSPLYTDLLVNNLFHSFSCLAIGQSVIGQPCLTYLQGVPVLSKVNTSGGVLGSTTNLIGMLYQNPPVRTADYLASIGQGLGIVKTANAQVTGSGANVLSPILRLWQVSRNISYVIMIIIFLVIGLMVMFRNKINPQTVITAQAALPGLVIGLIMITFSYFLAGLISDMAFVGTNVVGYYFSAVRGHADQPQDLVNDLQSKNVLNIFAPFTKIVDSSKVADALGAIWNDLAAPNTNRLLPWDLDAQKVLTTLASFMVAQIIMPFGGLFGGPGQIVAGIISFGGTGLAPVQVASMAIAFIAMAILIYSMFKLLLRLINNYITIIFLTITAPFQLLASALPGRQGIATEWILNMLANVLAFPAVLAVFYFVAFILGPNLQNVCPAATCPFLISNSNQIQNNGFVKSAQAADPIQITDTNSFPLFGGLDLNFINLLLAFGALTALPAIPDILARTIGKMSQAGQLIGQEISGSYGAGQRYAGQFQQGPSGIAQQAGRWTDDKGLYLTQDPMTREVSWRKVGPDSPLDIQARLLQAGQGTKIRNWVRTRLGR